MTEDMLEQHAEALVKLGSNPEGAVLRARMQSACLFSDMEAFKVSALNARCRGRCHCNCHEVHGSVLHAHLRHGGVSGCGGEEFSLQRHNLPLVPSGESRSEANFRGKSIVGVYSFFVILLWFYFSHAFLVG